MNLRQIISKNKMAGLLLRKCESKMGRRVRFQVGTSNEWDPANHTITAIPEGSWRRLFTSGNIRWVLSHEVAHVAIEVFWPQFDQKIFRRLFGGYPTWSYPEGMKYRVAVLQGLFSGRVGISLYAKSLPVEAWSEAVAHVLTCSPDRHFNAAQIRQLSYVEQTLEAITKSNGRKKFPKYHELEIDLECAECGEEFVLGPCRAHGERSGWITQCPYCSTTLEL